MLTELEARWAHNDSDEVGGALGFVTPKLLRTGMSFWCFLELPVSCKYIVECIIYIYKKLLVFYL